MTITVSAYISSTIRLLYATPSPTTNGTILLSPLNPQYKASLALTFIFGDLLFVVGGSERSPKIKTINLITLQRQTFLNKFFGKLEDDGIIEIKHLAQPEAE
eukprot:gene3849-4446_t